ncbi:hypothetical protein OEA41_000211 [Lepraria neglecta]|uniref:Alpha-galactosidase n=1 Tax=Lepraria neglecta TaxID=209136 RepID=A0AAD9ZFB9_9LECA|nr:hypothetical protein OEA41_000211 [Lepraria neglecta]
MDGMLYFQPHQPPSELGDYLRGYSSDLSIHSVPSEAPDTQLWSLTSPVRGAVRTESGWANISLGIPRSYTRWFSLVRIWSPWLAPRHGKDIFNPPQDALLSSFLRWDGLHLVLLAVSGVDDVLTVFKGDHEGNVIISARNDRPEISEARVIAAVGTSFENANAAVMYHARKIVRGDEYMSNEIKAEMKTAIENDVRAEWMENWYDGLTYCTWNALGQDLNEDKIYKALDILKKNNIKSKAGYWGAISPNGNIAKDYKTVKLHKESSLIPGDHITMVDADDIARMYNDFYKFLLTSGVDSVKTDAQFVLDLLADAPDRLRFIKSYQDAWTINSLRYFSIRAISCMSQLPQILFHTQLPLNKPRMMVRNSDDFFPGIPTSHPWHIFVNAHNSLLTSHLNILPDWDMFQTIHSYSGFHAAGRCVSGGPIYITDEPGEHNIELLNEMTARTIKDTTIILRPPVIGKTVEVYTAYEEERLLKVGTFTGGKGGTSILALFNVSERVLSELVNINAFPGIESGEEYVVRAHSTGEISRSIRPDSETPVVSLEVDFKGYEILSAYRLQAITRNSSPAKVAILGLLGKMTGAAAVTSSNMKINDQNGRLQIEVVLKALGMLGIFVSTLHDMSVEDDLLIMLHGMVIPMDTVKICQDKPVLEIDVEKAWNAMKIHPGWSNEVTLEVFVR